MSELHRFIHRGAYAVETCWTHPFLAVQLSKTSWIKGSSDNTGYGVSLSKASMEGSFSPVENRNFKSKKEMEAFVKKAVKLLEGMKLAKKSGDVADLPKDRAFIRGEWQ